MLNPVYKCVSIKECDDPKYVRIQFEAVGDWWEEISTLRDSGCVTEEARTPSEVYLKEYLPLLDYQVGENYISNGYRRAHD